MKLISDFALVPLTTTKNDIFFFQNARCKKKSFILPCPEDFRFVENKSF